MMPLKHLGVNSPPGQPWNTRGRDNGAFFTSRILGAMRSALAHVWANPYVRVATVLVGVLLLCYLLIGVEQIGTGLIGNAGQSFASCHSGNAHTHMIRELLLYFLVLHLSNTFEESMYTLDEFGVFKDVPVVITKAASERAPRRDAYWLASFDPLNSTHSEP
jgi:hypothetical protein